MKRIFRFLGMLAVILLVGSMITALILHEALPQGEQGKEADALAHNMLTALNYEKFNKTNVIKWSFRNGAHQYIWHKNRGVCNVRWDDYNVTLQLGNPNKSMVLQSGKIITQEKKQVRIAQKALNMFNNDSFWLVAPFKIFDKGTERRIVNLKDGSKGLLVTYTLGGTTPGDSYLWILNDSGFPKSFKMWVNIIPIGGLEASWNDWMVTQSGGFLPKSHKLGPVTMKMGEVNGY